MKQSDLDVLIARRERRVRNFFLWFWLGFCPALGIVLFIVFSHGEQPHHPDPPQVPTYNCQSAAAEVANVDPNNSGIAPLCGGIPSPGSGDGG